MRKALCIASVASNLDNFNRDNVEILLSLGYDVTLASNFDTSEDVNSREKIDAFKEEMIAKGVHIQQIDFTRSLGNIKQQLKSVRQVKQLLKNRYDLIHCHSPICAAITRYVARKNRKKYGTSVLYTAHGFHFYDGAPLKNWIIFYPIEKILSKYTDVLITINKEDYNRARKKFKARQTKYIHGIGIDSEKFSASFNNVNKKRNELGIEDNDIMILSVGELSVRKNQRIVIEAIAKIKNPHIHYFMAGIGNMHQEYENLAKELNINENIHFLGYRTDISELCCSADLYVFPSLQEGLPVALMEAISCKVPVICSDIRGNTDLIADQNCLFNSQSSDSLAKCLKRIIGNKGREEIRAKLDAVVDENYKRLKMYNIENVHKEMKSIYMNVRKSR